MFKQLYYKIIKKISFAHQNSVCRTLARLTRAEVIHISNFTHCCLNLQKIFNTKFYDLKVGKDSDRYLFDKMSFYKMSFFQNVFFSKCLFFKMSFFQNVFFSKCLFFKMSFFQNVFFSKCLFFKILVFQNLFFSKCLFLTKF